MNDVVATPILSQPAVPTLHKTDSPAKIREAAQQFEALLIGQLLANVSESSGWLGSGGDSAGSCATGFAQEQLASVMAKSGGFGLSKMIASGLERSSDGGESQAPAVSR